MNKPSKMPREKQVASSEFQRNTRRYIPEDSTLHNRRYKNLKSNEVIKKFKKSEKFMNRKS
jgi:hypothetical protein